MDNKDFELFLLARSGQPQDFAHRQLSIQSLCLSFVHVTLYLK